jgi:hypothetical protein
MTTLTPTTRRRRSGCGRALWGRSRCRSLQGRRCLLLIGYVGAVKRLAALCHVQCLEDGIGGENWAVAGCGLSRVSSWQDFGLGILGDARVCQDDGDVVRAAPGGDPVPADGAVVGPTSPSTNTAAPRSSADLTSWRGTTGREVRLDAQRCFKTIPAAAGRSDHGIPANRLLRCGVGGIARDASRWFSHSYLLQGCRAAAVRRLHRRWASAGMDHPGPAGGQRPGGVAVGPRRAVSRVVPPSAETLDLPQGWRVKREVR